MRAKLVNESVNPRIPVEEFISWFDGIYNANPEVHWEWVLGALENDEDSSNDELKEYFMKEDDNMPEELIDELLAYRMYFLDFRYSQHIDV